MIFDVSQIQTYAKCPRKWIYSSIQNIQGPVGQALIDGIKWHELCAHESQKHEGGTAAPTEVLTDGDPYWMHKGLEEWVSHLQLMSYKTLAVELPLSAPVGRHMLVGKIDAHVEWQGKCWNLQHKTVRSSMSMSHYFSHLARSWHEAAYGFLVRYAQTYPSLSEPQLPVSRLPYGGSIIVLARKLKRGNVLVVQPVPIEDIAGTIRELEDYMTAMVWSGTHRVEYALANRDACFGAWGNQPCHFLPACNGQVEPQKCGILGSSLSHYDRVWLEKEYARHFRSTRPLAAFTPAKRPCEAV